MMRVVGRRTFGGALEHIEIGNEVRADLGALLQAQRLVETETVGRIGARIDVDVTIERIGHLPHEQRNTRGQDAGSECRPDVDSRRTLSRPSQERKIGIAGVEGPAPRFRRPAAVSVSMAKKPSPIGASWLYLLRFAIA